VPPRLAGSLLAADLRPSLARPRDQPEVAGRRKHHTADQQQAQGGERRGPAKSCRRAVAGKKGRSQSVFDSQSLLRRQLVQRLGRAHERRQRPQLLVRG
jgi:hypothetical protein